jgi:two-component system chemotaxis response regulator CheV
MAAGIKTPQQSDILLESGTNELEVLVFGVGKGLFGVNVAKVREVITPMRITACPGQPGSVRGVFNLRGVVLPLVDLHQFLGFEPVHDDPKNRRIIVTEFNGQQAAFQVEHVEHIHRMSWTRMKGVPDSHGNSNFAITGITEVGDRLVLMLDFESIYDAVAFQSDLHVESVDNTLGVDRAARRVLIAEDSPFVIDMMSSVLINSGYGHVETVKSGAAAWEALEAGLAGKQPLPDVVISDVEMPQMDGMALTKRIKEHPGLRHLPVLLFSSLITDDTRHKGQAVGADQQLGKPDLPRLVQIVDGYVQGLEAAA